MDAAYDGRRLLVSIDETDEEEVETRPHVTVVLGWFDEIAERLGS
jgi:hypothetical protein